MSPTEMLGSREAWREYECKGVPDPVLVAPIPGGGLISYRRSDGRFVHTLGDEEGFLRKLVDLGLNHPDISAKG